MEVEPWGGLESDSDQPRSYLTRRRSSVSHQIQKILAVCFGNTCRSPMMAALLQRKLNDLGITEVTVESAGTASVEAIPEPQPAAEHSVAMMAERGIDITSHRSQYLRDMELGTIDLFVVVDEATAEAVREQTGAEANVVVLNRANDGVPNPWPHRNEPNADEVYRRCAYVIDEAIVRDVIRPYISVSV